MNKDKHGSPFDRGSADCYYRRQFNPHYWPEGTGNGEKITDLTRRELTNYREGWNYKIKIGDFKQW